MPGRKAPEEQRRHDILRAAFAVAARSGLAGVTARSVATEARISSGLVFFYFKTIDALLIALLDWLLERTIVAGEVRGLAVTIADPAERMLAIVRRDIERLPRQRARVELFFDYWVLGTRNPAVRQTIRGALDRYRDSLLVIAQQVVESAPQRFAGVTPLGLAGVVAGFIEGCALQAVMDPSRFDVEQYMATLGALVAHPVPTHVS
ncbi:MAG TPA: TetR family transcriptional regulator C-terminal domain-containing protein [Gemmatimonadaceae bacterium]|jgi:AcrR family transcriptional regulator|nr:TetR family transcriptional regulator C-terminal domain-containing protein [Gemmatimonadaceae bacterium]